jgi:hypothetical protein
MRLTPLHRVRGQAEGQTMNIMNTPTDAKRYAREIAANCFNDEIKAHVARELLSWICAHANPAIAEARELAVVAAGTLTSAYDRQYRD